MNLNDLGQFFGNDLSVSATGDLLQVDSVSRGQQRILRRLLTNPAVTGADGSTTQADYIFHPGYGAGLPQWIGNLRDTAKIKALIRGQMLLEDSVAQFPEPSVDVQEIPNGLSCYIRYTDAPSGTQQVLSFNVTA